MIDIHQGQTKHIVSHSVTFVTPNKVSEKDKFSVQCSRFSQTKSIQRIRNRFSLNILHGNHDILVGMVPLKIDFESMPNPGISKTLEFKLSAVKLETFDSMSTKTMFFASPTSDLISITENQEFGHWLYLLPGQYRIGVNGTEKEIALGPGQSLKIRPSFIKISTNPSVDLRVSSNILVSPLYVELNGQHWLDLNVSYPVLAGTLNLKLNGSLKSKVIELKQDESINLVVRSVQVALDCPPWTWECLGNRKVYLFEKDKVSPFAQGTSDAPILYFETDAYVSVEGSRDLKYKLPTNKEHHSLKVGFIKLDPKPAFRANVITDLVRIEAIGAPFDGFTLDLPLESPSTIPLIEGKFYLSQYNSFYGNEYERRNSKRLITIRQQHTPEVSFRVFVSAKKWEKYKKDQKKSDDRKKQNSRISRKQISRPVIPLQLN
ncbi:MAG: hypothetical protein HRU19_07495 [Pseudobacteriovorax sp.]|nr:hypothetical protein [Pseudobacteriovorax sp.]